MQSHKNQEHYILSEIKMMTSLPGEEHEGAQ